MTYDNNLNNNHDEIQFSLIKASKIGNINLMLDFIIAGANPFLLDDESLTPIMHAMKIEPEKVSILLLGLSEYINLKKASS